MVPAAPPLDIPVDPELADAPSPHRGVPSAAGARQGTLRQRLEAAAAEEHLQADPLRLHRVRVPDQAPWTAAVMEAYRHVPASSLWSASG